MNEALEDTVSLRFLFILSFLEELALDRLEPL